MATQEESLIVSKHLSVTVGTQAQPAVERWPQSLDP